MLRSLKNARGDLVDQMGEAEERAQTAPAPRDYAALAARIRAAVEPLQPPLALRVYGQQVGPAALARPSTPAEAVEGVEPAEPRVAVAPQDPGPAEALPEDERYDLFLVTLPARAARPNGRARWSVMLNGGTHGDEPAGAEAVVRFLEERRYTGWPDVAFTVTPCTNPWGYVHNRREGPGGLDLNRSFRRASPRTPEVSLLKQALRRRVFDLYLDCHEDVDTPGLYVFAPTALGRAIVEAVRPVGPIHPGDLVDGEIPLNDGVVELDNWSARRPRGSWTTWPLPYYVSRYHQRRPDSPSAREDEASVQRRAAALDIPFLSTATIETPPSLPLEQRVAMHLAAIDATLATLESK